MQFLTALLCLIFFSLGNASVTIKNAVFAFIDTQEQETYGLAKNGLDFSLSLQLEFSTNPGNLSFALTGDKTLFPQKIMSDGGCTPNCTAFQGGFNTYSWFSDFSWVTSFDQPTNVTFIIKTGLPIETAGVFNAPTLNISSDGISSSAVVSPLWGPFVYSPLNKLASGAQLLPKKDKTTIQDEITGFLLHVVPEMPQVLTDLASNQTTITATIGVAITEGIHHECEMDGMTTYSIRYWKFVNIDNRIRVELSVQGVPRVGTTSLDIRCTFLNNTKGFISRPSSIDSVEGPIIGYPSNSYEAPFGAGLKAHWRCGSDPDWDAKCKTSAELRALGQTQNITMDIEIPLPKLLLKADGDTLKYGIDLYFNGAINVQAVSDPKNSRLWDVEWIFPSERSIQISFAPTSDQVDAGVFRLTVVGTGAYDTPTFSAALGLHTGGYLDIASSSDVDLIVGPQVPNAAPALHSNAVVGWLLAAVLGLLFVLF